MEKSCFIIKPDGFLHCEDIYMRIRAAGLEITDTQIIPLPTQALDHIYPNLEWEVRTMLKGYLCADLCIVGIVEGERAVQTLIEVVGDNTDPALCREGTIRQTYGFSRSSPRDPHLNVIHRPTMLEVKDQLFFCQKLIRLARLH